MSTKTKTVRGQTQQKAAAGDSIWTKATTANYEWTDKVNWNYRIELGFRPRK